MSHKDELIRSMEGGYAAPEDFAIGDPLDLTCAACGYEMSDDGSAIGDHGHDNLCCGVAGPCAWASNPKDLCITHDPFYQSPPAVDFDGSPLDTTPRDQIQEGL